MSIPAGSTKVVLSGVSPQGEIFATGFWLSGGAINSEASANIAAQAIADMTKWTDTGDGSPVKLIGADTQYQTVTVYHYANAGSRAQFIGEAALAGQVGTANQGPLPLQCAVVVSLRTGLPGRSRRGRMYLPATNQSLTLHQLSHVVL